MTVREIALKLLIEYESSGKYINLSLSSHSADNLSYEERSFLTALLYTSVERKITYDYWICALSGRSIDKIDDRTRNILRLGLAQITAFDSIPDFAAVNETVKLASNKGARAFINGILRAAVRAKGELPLPDKNKNYPRYLSVYHSFPLWLVKRFIKEYGEEGCEALLSSFNSSDRYTDITVNTVKTTQNEYLELLKKQGIEAVMSPYSHISIRILSSVNPKNLPGYLDGSFFVQDSSCAASVGLLEIKEDSVVLDACACPGGKSFASAILASDKGRVYSFDLHESKLSLIESGAKRLGLDSITPKAVDATVGDDSLIGKVDRVICDVPCSGLGVLGKKPDIRYKDEKSIEELPSLQLSILNKSAEYLKPGGFIIYSTCTLNKKENEDVVESFLNSHSDFEPVDFSVGQYSSQGGSFTFVPYIHGTDGFFVAKLRKK